MLVYIVVHAIYHQCPSLGRPTSCLSLLSLSSHWPHHFPGASTAAFCERPESTMQNVSGEGQSNVVQHPVQAAIRDGFVRVNNGVPSKPGLALRPGDVVACRLPPPPSMEASPEVPHPLYSNDQNM